MLYAVVYASTKEQCFSEKVNLKFGSVGWEVPLICLLFLFWKKGVVYDDTFLYVVVAICVCPSIYPSAPAYLPIYFQYAHNYLSDSVCVSTRKFYNVAYAIDLLSVCLCITPDSFFVFYAARIV
jgi:hypothetical protein